ncbi:hypothetical protein [Dyadobacter pollutisoli]|uniref:Uncharacterized protein n=1 Tax=Dyadobacter pollutisoli TaxID=2910158 RepID=A0A9E8N9X8_9BACT|nr:hypothetical protein [Dyadobacter pollutisoli]WAC10539.1 hypothetical protein ON006_22675 [Dyadobacter pollutisoli]
MRSVISYILLFSIMLPTLSPWGTIAYFKLNRDYIARVLCENRARPQMHCNGKCYLAKKLKQQQEKQDKETSEKVQNTPVIQLFTSPFHSYSFETSPAVFLEKVRFFHQLQCYTAPAAKLLRPPKR